MADGEDEYDLQWVADGFARGLRYAKVEAEREFVQATEQKANRRGKPEESLLPVDQQRKKAISGALQGSVFAHLSPGYEKTDGPAARPIRRDDIFLLLEDPLGAATRATRRNLMTACAIGLFAGATGQVPETVPSVGLKLGGPLPVLLFLSAFLLYELVMFWSYVDGDIRRLHLLEGKVRDTRETLRRTLAEIEDNKGVAALADEPIAEKLPPLLDDWLKYARGELDGHGAGYRSATFRRVVDSFLPRALALIVLGLLAFRIWKALT